MPDEAATHLEDRQHAPSKRLLVVMPHWVGDVVMATPTLRALRQLYPQAHITLLIRRSLRPLIDAGPWHDRAITVRHHSDGDAAGKSTNALQLVRRVAAGKFDTAVILPDNFRPALLVRMAAIKRRVGYDRDSRGGLLTDRLLPRRVRGKFIPVPTREYYLGLARYLGAEGPDPAMQLFTRHRHDEQARQLLAKAGWQTNENGKSSSGGRPLIVMAPGSSWGHARRWPAGNFAAVADECARKLGAVVALCGSPAERPLLDQVRAAAKSTLIDLPALGADLTLTKSVIRMSQLVIGNDTGPRHIAAAFGVPSVAIFGPSDPVWSDTDSDREAQLKADVFCQPCQKKNCPLRDTPDDHICMRQVEPAKVLAAAAGLLEMREAGRAGA